MKGFITFLSCIVIITMAQNDILPYQSHSFNDLNYIKQQMIKGYFLF